MQTVQKYQNEVYALALSLTCNAKTAKNAAVKAFEKTLASYHTDSAETKKELYRNLLKFIGYFDIKKKELDRKGPVNSVKHSLKLFDKKVFVLKYERGCSLDDIVYILNEKPLKVKKSLLKSADKIARALEETESEM